MLDVERVTAAVDRLCAGQGDVHELRVRGVELLREVLGFDAFVWVLTDPVTTVGGAPYAEVPEADLPRLIRLRYLARELREAEGQSHLLSPQAGRGRRFEDLIAAHGVRGLASSWHADRYGCWAFLDLWRTSKAFDAAEGAVLDAVRPRLAAAIRRCQAGSLREGTGRFEVAGSAVVVLDDDLAVVGDTELAQTWLARLLPPATGRDPVPAAAFNVAAQLLAVEAGVDRHEPTTRVHLGDGRWLRVSAARMVSADRSRLIAVTLEPLTGAHRLDLFVRSHGLSPREAQLVEWVAAGASTGDVARRMHLSPYTVQDHVTSVLSKTGAPNRRALAARALGVVAVEMSED